MFYQMLGRISKHLNHHKHYDYIEAILIEISLRETKWFIRKTCYSPSQNDEYHFYELEKLVDIYS